MWHHHVSNKDFSGCEAHVLKPLHILSLEASSPKCAVSTDSSILTSVEILLISGDDRLWRENGKLARLSEVSEARDEHCLKHTISYPSSGIMTSNVFVKITLITQKSTAIHGKMKSKAK